MLSPLAYWWELWSPPRETLIKFSPCLQHPSLTTIQNVCLAFFQVSLLSNTLNTTTTRENKLQQVFVWSFFLLPSKWILFVSRHTKKHFYPSVHVKRLNQKLWPGYHVQWTQAAASLQPLSIKAQLVTPKPAFEKALRLFIPDSQFPEQPAFCDQLHRLIAAPATLNMTLIDCVKLCCCCWPSACRFSPVLLWILEHTGCNVGLSPPPANRI